MFTRARRFFAFFLVTTMGCFWMWEARAATDTCHEVWSTSGEHFHAGEQNGANTPDVCFGNRNHPSGTIERFELGGGVDEAHGRDGEDDMYGGHDEDQLFGMAGQDQVYGQWEDDHLSGGDGADTVDGAGGDDVVHGDAGNDAVYGGDSAENLSNGAAPDSLKGDSGNDGLIDRCCNGDHDGACGGTGDDSIDILDGDESDAAFDKNTPTKDSGDLWMQQNSCTVNDGAVAGIDPDGIQALIDGAPDDAVEVVLEVLDLLDIVPIGVQHAGGVVVEGVSTVSRPRDSHR